MLSSSWTTSGLPIGNHPGTKGYDQCLGFIMLVFFSKFSEQKRVYLLMRLISVGLVLCSEKPASISKSSSSECSWDEPLLAPTVWLSVPFEVYADVGLSTARLIDRLISKFSYQVNHEAIMKLTYHISKIGIRLEQRSPDIKTVQPTLYQREESKNICMYGSSILLKWIIMCKDDNSTTKGSHII